MNKNKLEDIALIASVHTVQVDSADLPVIQEGETRFIKSRLIRNRQTGEITSKNIINPHNYEYQEILNYSKYKTVMQELTETVGLSDYSYSRIDFRLDSYEDNYLEYFKLNSLLTGLLTMKYRFKNNEPTESTGQRTRLKCSVYVKNQRIAVEYYDKKKESLDRFPCKARLEFRELRADGKTPEDVAHLWFARLDNLAGYYNVLQLRYNKSLFEHYQYWLEANKLTTSGSNFLTAFVRENQDAIFSIRQLEKFCEMCGVKNPASRAKNIKKTCNIECFSYNDIKSYINIIKVAITSFLEQ